jgi:hypothetical protein
MDDEIGKVCNMHGGDNECIQGVGWGSEENGPAMNSQVLI